MNVLDRTTIDQAWSAILFRDLLPESDGLSDRELTELAVSQRRTHPHVEALLRELRMVERARHPSRHRPSSPPPPLSKPQRKAARAARTSHVPTPQQPWSLNECFQERDRLLEEKTPPELIWDLAASAEDPLPYELPYEHEPGRTAGNTAAVAQPPHRVAGVETAKWDTPPAHTHVLAELKAAQAPLPPAKAAPKRKRRQDPSGEALQKRYGLNTRTLGGRRRTHRATRDVERMDWNIDAAHDLLDADVYTPPGTERREFDRDTWDFGATLEQHAVIVQAVEGMHLTATTGAPPGRPVKGVHKPNKAGELIMVRFPGRSPDELRAVLKHGGKRTPEQTRLAAEIADTVRDLQEQATMQAMAKWLRIGRQSLYRLIK